MIPWRPTLAGPPPEINTHLGHYPRLATWQQFRKSKLMGGVRFQASGFSFHPLPFDSALHFRRATLPAGWAIEFERYNGIDGLTLWCWHGDADSFRRLVHLHLTSSKRAAGNDPVRRRG